MLSTIAKFFAPTKAEAQTDRIVARLKKGSATNEELARIALKYTSRISDARKRGYIIECSKVSGHLTQYRLLGGA